MMENVATLQQLQFGFAQLHSSCTHVRRAARWASEAKVLRLLTPLSIPRTLKGNPHTMGMHADAGASSQSQHQHTQNKFTRQGYRDAGGGKLKAIICGRESGMIGES